jgi:hypothetical protein
MLYGALTVALGFSLFSLAIPSSGPGVQRSLLLFNCFLVQRSIFLSLVIFLFIILIFLARYPVSLTRNVVLHSFVYSAFFLSHSLALLFRTVIGYDVGRSVNLVLVGVSTACVLAWLVLLSRRGEEQAMTWHRRWEPDQERRLVEQLNAMNQSLMRVARK